MNAAERAMTVAVLYAWAEWCDQNTDRNWSSSPLCHGGAAWRAAWDWCEPVVRSGVTSPFLTIALRGHEAALALCFAAAMIASGDTSRGER